VEAAKEVGPSLFFSLLIITISFMPIFVLTGESGRLFRPLAFQPRHLRLAAAVDSLVTHHPVLMVYFITARVTETVGMEAGTCSSRSRPCSSPPRCFWYLTQLDLSLMPYRWWMSMAGRCLRGCFWFRRRSFTKRRIDQPRFAGALQPVFSA